MKMYQIEKVKPILLTCIARHPKAFIASSVQLNGNSICTYFRIARKIIENDITFSHEDAEKIRTYSAKPGPKINQAKFTSSDDIATQSYDLQIIEASPEPEHIEQLLQLLNDEVIQTGIACPNTAINLLKIKELSPSYPNISIRVDDNQIQMF